MEVIRNPFEALSSPRFSENSFSDDPRIEAVWTLRSGDGRTGGDPHYVPPDGSVDLILRMVAGQPVSIMVHPPSLCFQVTRIPFHEELVGVRFRPGIAGPLLENSVKIEQALFFELQNNFQPGGRLEQSLVAAGQSVLALYGSPPAMIMDAIAHIEEESGNVRIAAIARLLGKNERTMLRAAAKWLGMPPKTFARVMRTRAAVWEIRKGKPIVEVAIDMGFSDQAHLTRDLHELLGVTPGKTNVKSVGFLQDASQGGGVSFALQTTTRREK